MAAVPMGPPDLRTTPEKTLPKKKPFLILGSAGPRCPDPASMSWDAHSASKGDLGQLDLGANCFQLAFDFFGFVF